MMNATVTQPHEDEILITSQFECLLRSAVLGELAYHKGINCSGQDPQMTPLLKGSNKDVLARLTAWSKAWHRERHIDVGLSPYPQGAGFRR